MLTKEAIHKHPAGVILQPHAADKSCEAKVADLGLVPNTASDAFGIILHQVGDYGKFQLLLTLIGAFCGVFTALHNMGAVFLSATPEHWCQVPFFQERDIVVTKMMRNFTAPLYFAKDFDEITSSNFSESEIYSAILYNLSNKKHFQDDVATCQAWVFDKEVYHSTIVSEWNLVCNKRWLMSTAQSSYMMGILTGSVVFSAISDKFGRRKSSLICVILFISSSVATSFSVSYVMFLVLRFVIAASVHGMFLVNYVLVMECVSSKGRNVLGNLYHTFFSFGITLLSLLAYYFRDWRTLQLACSVPSVLLLGYFWFLPESPRWLLINNKKEEGLKILRHIASVNNKQLPEESYLNELLAVIFKEVKPKKKNNIEENIKSVMKNVSYLFWTPNMRRRSLIIFYAWFVVAMIYYGLTFIGENIHASLYVTVALSGAIEFPGIAALIFLLQNLGRRSTLIGTLLFAGLSCTGIAFVPSNMVYLNLTLVTVGKFMVALSLMLVHIFSAELVPTQVRNISIGMGSMCARIGAGLAPYMVDLLGDIYFMIPFTLFGALAILSGLLCLLLPETGNKNLPESIEEIESMSR